MRMTRDEVLAMTNEQLRIKAAELRGFTEICVRHLPVPWLMDLVEDVPSGYLDDKLRVIPDYPNDIAAGFTELIPMIIRATSHPDREEAETIAIKYYSENCPPFVGGPWAVNMIKEWHPSSFGGYAPIYIEIGGERPEQAITRAFIIAMEEKHE